MRVTSSALLLLGAASSSLAFIVPARLASAPLASRRSVLSMSTTAESTNLKDIVDTAVGAGSFKTLATALTVAGLVDTLKSSGPFTVFAPTDEAFAKIPKPTLDAILSDKAKLTSILTYHVVPGVTKAQDILSVPSAKTVQGQSLSVKVADGKVKVGGANVLATDVMASNGVIHVIDTVLLPPAPVSSTPAKPSLATLEVQKAGATAPFGFFDPLGLSEGKSVKELKKWRESELKHGRVAMLATVGVIVQEVFSPFYSPETGSADPGPAAFHFQKLEAVNPFVLGYIAVLVAVLEAFTISKGWDSKGEYGGSDIAGLKDEYLTGDFAFDPLNLAPKKDQEKFLSQRSKELNNGRLAMIAWIGMVAQELATGDKLFG